MRRRSWTAALAVVVCCAAPGVASAGGGGARDVYSAKVDGPTLKALTDAGTDVSVKGRAGARFDVELILDRAQRRAVRAKGVDVRLTRVRGGLTVRQFALAQADNGFAVWRSYDEPGGFRDQMYAAARENQWIAKLVKLGTTIQGREILAVKLTQGARFMRDGRRPAVLYNSVQHAREWIAGEVNRRLMFHVINRWRAGDQDIRRLLRRTELWFVLVANPDGYQYTFEAERLWRKNLRDNDGNGQITSADGVDPNRNYPEHWGYDNEGSSPIFSSETYRGPGPASEAETQALKGLMDRVGFEFLINYHSAGEWLLYGEGWQIASPTADDPIYFALSGNLDRAAIPGYHPGLASDVLYVTNGDTNDYAHAQTGALAWTPELAEGCEGCGFVFPDDPALVQAEFERNLPFALSVARSAPDPDDPKSSLGIETKPFYLESDDPYKEGIPAANFKFRYSYGDPQPVQVLAKRELGRVTLRYRINNGRVQSARTVEWDGGERYGPVDVHYREMRGVVTGTSPGDSVTVWFEARGERSESFTYQAVSETGRRVLVVAAEDYTGASPNQTPGPHYLQYYLDALAANGVQADVYDVDARGRIAPDHIGVLSHYDAVIWYTGDDVVTRQAGRGPGNADRLAMDEILEFRAYMNEGGRVAYTGKYAGMQFTGAAVGTQMYDPMNEGACNPPDPTWDERRCLALRGSLIGGDQVNDVLEYWFGGFLQVAGDGLAEDGTVFDMVGSDDPFEGLSWSFNGAQSADNQDNNSSFVATSGILPPDRFPQFESWPASRWDKPGGPFDPRTGSRYVYSGIADVSYKRLTRRIQVPSSGGNLTFWTSYDTEEHWDYFAVEARTVGAEDWTTLPDANGHTTRDTGESCPEGWAEDLHPVLERYQTVNPGEPPTCSPTGTTGEWHAASGNSNGWQQWSIDLSRYAGRTIELSLSYISDWATQNLGVFLDDVTLPDGTSTSFENGLDGWTVAGPPEGSGVNGNDWEVADAGGFPVGATIATPDSLLMGYGFEGISTPAERQAVMGRMLAHLLP